MITLVPERDLFQEQEKNLQQKQGLQKLRQLLD